MSPFNPDLETVSTTPYHGRFAPSPTGPLHFGSLLTAIASFLQARTNNGKWYVRIEDLDPPRELPGASLAILKTLEKYGLYWDDEVLYQSSRKSAYQRALDFLKNQYRVYPCNCSRRQIRLASKTTNNAAIYPGTCRSGTRGNTTTMAYRLRTNDKPIQFKDRIVGVYQQVIEQEVGDFVVRRTDGLTAYQLAVVVDDFHQGITEVVRGTDLLSSTPRQIYLQELLGYPTPDYAHLPLVLTSTGQKLSKQNHAPSIHELNPQKVLYNALIFLGQQPPVELEHATPDEILAWAKKHWKFNRIPLKNSQSPVFIEPTKMVK